MIHWPGDVSWLSGLIVEISQPMFGYRRFVSIGVFSLWSLQTTTLTRQDKRNSVRVRHCFFKILFVPLNCEIIVRGYLETVSPSHSLATNRFTFQLQNYTIGHNSLKINLRDQLRDCFFILCFMICLAVITWTDQSLVRGLGAVMWSQIHCCIRLEHSKLENQKYLEVWR